MKNEIRILLLSALLLMALALVGCSDDDDPVTPVVEDPQAMAVSPDSLAAMFEIAFDSSDPVLLGSLLADDFRYALSAETVGNHELPTSYLNRAETLQSLGLIFEGQDATGNVLEADWGPITGVRVTAFEKMTDWEESGELSPYPGSVQSLWTTTIDFELADGTSLLRADQSLNFFATAVDTVLEDDTVAQRYELVRVYNFEASLEQSAKSETMLLGEILCGSLVPTEPTPVLSLTDAGGFPYVQIQCDAAASIDPVHDLAPFAFRFSSLERAGGWTTGWLADPIYDREFDEPGTHTVQVEVRNRWNLSATAHDSVAAVVAAPPAATTPEQLVDNFVGAYETMAIDALSGQLDDRFLMVLSTETQFEWGWSTDFHFDASIFVAAHTQMFRGDPGSDADGNIVHPIDRIDIDVFEQLAAWEPVPAEDPHFGSTADLYTHYRVNLEYFNADLSHKFEVQQNVAVYLSEIDNSGTTEYRLVGLRGLTNGLKTDSVEWDDVVALYR